MKTTAGLLAIATVVSAYRTTLPEVNSHRYRNMTTVNGDTVYITDKCKEGGPDGRFSCLEAHPHELTTASYYGHEPEGDDFPKAFTYLFDNWLTRCGETHCEEEPICTKEETEHGEYEYCITYNGHYIDGRDAMMALIRRNFDKMVEKSQYTFMRQGNDPSCAPHVCVDGTQYYAVEHTGHSSIAASVFGGEFSGQTLSVAMEQHSVDSTKCPAWSKDVGDAVSVVPEFGGYLGGVVNFICDI